MELVNNSLQVQYKVKRMTGLGSVDFPPQINNKTQGAGKSDEACAVRANYPIPSVCGIYYWEIEVISKGRDGYMGIGLSGESVLLTRLPGWETNSYGYHADDGNSFCQSGSGKAYGPTFSTGDIVGCGYNFIDNTVFFTKNGFHLGVAFRDLKGTFYPTVGLRTPGEIVIANFGQKPFRYDIESFMRVSFFFFFFFFLSQKLTTTPFRTNVSGCGVSSHRLTSHRWEATELSTRSSSPTWSITATPRQRSLLVTLLSMSSFYNHLQMKASTSGLIQSADGSSDPQQSNLFSTLNQQLTSIKERQRIRETLLGGNIDDAMELAERLFPTVLAKNPPYSLPSLLICIVNQRPAPELESSSN